MTAHRHRPESAPGHQHEHTVDSLQSGERAKHDVHDSSGHDGHAGHGGPEGHAGQVGHHTSSGHGPNAGQPSHAGQADHAGHGGHGGHGDHVGQFRRLFWLMLVLAVPVIGFSQLFAMLLGYQLPAAGWVDWVSPLLGTVVYLWGGRPFLAGAVGEVRTRQPGMMLLISLAITVAFVALGAPVSVCARRAQLLVGAVAADCHHAARPLDRNAIPGPDHLRAGLVGRATAGSGRAGRGRCHRARGPRESARVDLVVVRPGGRIPADGRSGPAQPAWTSP